MPMMRLMFYHRRKQVSLGWTANSRIDSDRNPFSHGGALYTDTATSMVLRNCDFSRNYAASGGAIAIVGNSESTNLSVSGCVFGYVRFIAKSVVGDSLLCISFQKCRVFGCYCMLDSGLSSTATIVVFAEFGILIDLCLYLATPSFLLFAAIIMLSIMAELCPSIVPIRLTMIPLIRTT